MELTNMTRLNDLSGRVIGAAIEVHRHLGPGLLESAYEECLCWELSQAGLPIQRQVELPLIYKGAVRVDCAYRVDLVVGRLLVVELKHVDSLQPVHDAQLLTYLRLLRLRLGLLINFNVPVLRQGVKRLINGFDPDLTVSVRETRADSYRAEPLDRLSRPGTRKTKKKSQCLGASVAP